MTDTINDFEVGKADTEKTFLAEGQVPRKLSKPKSWAEVGKNLKPLTWDWDPWLLQGFLTVFVGLPGSGKSMVILDSICRPYLKGTAWPDGKPFTGEIGKVLWLEAEGLLRLNYSRAGDYGLPLEGFLTTCEDEVERVSLEDAGQRREIEEAAMDPDVRLIILDSLSTSHSGEENSSRDMIPVLQFLAELAGKTKKPVIATHHLNKKEIQPGQRITQYHIRGSTSIAQLARTVWGLSQLSTDDDDEVKEMYIVKTNAAKHPDPIGLTTTEKGIVTVELSQSSAKAKKLAPQKMTLQKKAAHFLPVLLKNGPMASTEVERLMEGAGLSYEAAEKVKDQLGIVTTKGSDGAWSWSLLSLDN